MNEQVAAGMIGQALHPDTARRIYTETEGIPLFVVETVRAGASQWSGETHATIFYRNAPQAGDRPPLPPRVYAVIAGRLAQLSAPARSLVGLAAVMGRAFTLDILLAAGNSDEESTVGVLDELWTKRIIRERGMNGYDFTHDKLREVAYAELSVPQRRLLHRRIAQALEIIDADDATMTVQCLDCGESYIVETDAFGDGAIDYYPQFVARQLQGGGSADTAPA